VRQVFTAVDRLADNPRPDGAFGGADLLRIHISRYRVLYEINDQQIRVSVIHLGRVRRPRRGAVLGPGRHTEKTTMAPMAGRSAGQDLPLCIGQVVREPVGQRDREPPLRQRD
jgi:hypothetical protein